MMNYNNGHYLQHHQQAHNALSIDVERQERTLFVRGIPFGMDTGAVYALLFHVPETVDDIVVGGLGVSLTRMSLRRVRLLTFPGQRLYKVAFIEFATHGAAAAWKRYWEGLDVTRFGGQQLQVERAANPIRGTHWADYDRATGRPCLFGLVKVIQEELNRRYGFSQAAFLAHRESHQGDQW